MGKSQDAVKGSKWIRVGQGVVKYALTDFHFVSLLGPFTMQEMGCVILFFFVLTGTCVAGFL